LVPLVFLARLSAGPGAFADILGSRIGGPGAA